EAAGAVTAPEPDAVAAVAPGREVGVAVPVPVTDVHQLAGQGAGQVARDGCGHVREAVPGDDRELVAEHPDRVRPPVSDQLSAGDDVPVTEGPERAQRVGDRAR